MLELILVRHGETDSNKKGTYLGWTDIELNELGLQQANCVRDKLRGTAVNAIISSPLIRAKRTAEIINETFKLHISYADELKERNFGLWDDLTYQEIVEKYPQEQALWSKDWINYSVPEGESSMEAYLRIAGYIDGLVTEKTDGVVLIVTHLGCIRKITAHLLNMGLEGSWRFRVDNCSVTRIQITEKYPVLTLLNG